MKRRGDRGKKMGGQGTCSTHHVPCRRQAEEIKGISQKCNMSTSTEWPLDGWVRPAASLSLNHSHPYLAEAKLTGPPDLSVTTMIFLPKRCYMKKYKASKGIWKNLLNSALSLIFALCKQAWTWGDIQISVLRCLRAVCLYKAVFRLKLYALLTYTSLKITLSTCFLSRLKLLQ